MVVSQALTVPVCDVNVLFAANVPLTSFNIKCDLKSTSGGFEETYLNPLLIIFTLCTWPIVFETANNLPPVPPTVVIATVGNLV